MQEKLVVDLKQGIQASEVEDRKIQFGSNKKKPVETKSIIYEIIIHKLLSVWEFGFRSIRRFYFKSFMCCISHFNHGKYDYCK